MLAWSETTEALDMPPLGLGAEKVDRSDDLIVDDHFGLATARAAHAYPDKPGASKQYLRQSWGAELRLGRMYAAKPRHLVKQLGH